MANVDSTNRRLCAHIEAETFSGEAWHLENIRSIVHLLMSYDSGVEVIQRFRGDEHQSEFHASDALLCSLVDEIPEKVRYTNVSIEPYARGILFDGGGTRERGRARTQSFKPELHQAVNQFLLPRQWDIPELVQLMSGSFVEAFGRLGKQRGAGEVMAQVRQIIIPTLPNRPNVLNETFVTKHGPQFTDLLRLALDTSNEEGLERLADYEGIPPLKEASTGQDLNQTSKVNARKLLEILLKIHGELTDVEEIMFLDTGIYYVREGQVIFRTSTEKYAKFFEEGLNHDIRNMRQKFDKLRRVDPLTMTMKVNTRFTDSYRQVVNIIREACFLNMGLTKSEMEADTLRGRERRFLERRLEWRPASPKSLSHLVTAPQSSLERMIETARGRGFDLTLSNLRNSPLANNPENQQLLMELLDEVRCLGRSHPMILYMGRQDSEGDEGIKADDISSLMTELSSYGNVNWWKSRFNGMGDFAFDSNGPACLRDADLAIAKNNRDAYKGIFVQKILASIFWDMRFTLVETRNRGSRKVDSSTFEIFKKVIGLGGLAAMKQHFVAKGFVEHTKEFESAIYMKYFIAYGSMYVNERNTGRKIASLPDGMRQFFDHYIAKKTSEIGGQSSLPPASS